MTHYEFLDRTVEQWETEPSDGLQWDDMETENTEDEYDVFDMYVDQCDRDVADGFERVDNSKHDFTYIDGDGEKHYVSVRIKQ